MWEHQSSQRSCRWLASRATRSSSSGSGLPCSTGFCQQCWFNIIININTIIQAVGFMQVIIVTIQNLTIIIHEMHLTFQDGGRVLRLLSFSETRRRRHWVGRASGGDCQQHHQPHGGWLRCAIAGHLDGDADSLRWDPVAVGINGTSWISFWSFWHLKTQLMETYSTTWLDTPLGSLSPKSFVKTPQTIYHHHQSHPDHHHNYMKYIILTCENTTRVFPLAANVFVKTDSA